MWPKGVRIVTSQELAKVSQEIEQWKYYAAEQVKRALRAEVQLACYELPAKNPGRNSENAT